MAVQGITFSKQLVTPEDDAHIYNFLLNGRKGKTKGCKMTFGKDDIYISNGYFFVLNRLIKIASMETVSTPIISTGTAYCRLVFEIDFAKTNTTTDFEQGYFKVLSSTTGYPEITQEDITNGGMIYQLPFAKFTKTVSGIGAFASELEAIGVADESKTIYVSTTGNNASGDGSESYPFATIQYVIDSLPKNLANKEITINIASGTYSENVEVAGFYGGTLRFELGEVAFKSFALYETDVIINGTSLTLNGSGNVYGFRCHRGANAILQCALTINGPTNGLYCSYGSRFSGRTVEINSCTNAVTSIYAAYIYIASLAGSKNNNGIAASGAIVSIGTIATIASTQYISSVGGRIYTGAQASVPSY